MTVKQQDQSGITRRQTLKAGAAGAVAIGISKGEPYEGFGVARADTEPTAELTVQGSIADDSAVNVIVREYEDEAGTDLVADDTLLIESSEGLDSPAELSGLEVDADHYYEFEIELGTDSGTSPEVESLSMELSGLEDSDDEDAEDNDEEDDDNGGLFDLVSPFREGGLEFFFDADDGDDDDEGGILDAISPFREGGVDFLYTEDDDVGAFDSMNPFREGGIEWFVDDDDDDDGGFWDFLPGVGN